MPALLALAVLAAALVFSTAYANPPLPPLPPIPPGQTALAPTAPAATAHIDGFRSARFGMGEEAVRAAIASDFRLSGTAVAAALNPVQRTAVLRIRTADLIPQGGTAQVDYIFGYRSHGLIEVNILWSAATDPSITPARLVENGAALQAYFARQGFAPARTTVNGILPDGNVLLFRASDEGGHAVVLVLAGRRVKPSAAGSSRLTPMALTLAYAADPAHPDVFQLKEGTF